MTSPNGYSPSVSRFSFFVSGLAKAGWFIALALFLLAFLPRVLDLDRFLTPDEFLWVDRSRNFLAGLTNPAYQCDTRVEKWAFTEGLACTLRTGHPGVTTMWSGSFGFLLRWLADGRPESLHDYVVAVSTNPLDPTFIAPERLGIVLLTSLGVVVFYVLARRLFGPAVALVAAALLALNPFHVAYSRVIHHDALSTTFMLLSVLCAFIYWGERQGRGWLALSGLLAGFAFLSKLSSLFLMPFIALIGLWFFVSHWRQIAKKPSSLLSPLSSLVLDGLLWFAVTVAVVFIFWPAMWVIPVETLQTAFALGFQYSTGPHAKGVFFLGESVADPGPWFYPVTWLYHTSPLVMLGLVGGAVVWLFNRWRNKSPKQAESQQAIPGQSTFTRYLPLILLFILGYYLLMTIGEKKQERYFLPVYPWFDLIAAAGLVSMATSLYLKRNTPRAIRHPLILLLIILLTNGYLLASTFPYYFTYYNPLLGGIKSAARVITIGWGEGLNLAADYLNTHVDPAQTRVASWYESTFVPYYHGPSISYSKEKGKALAGDYVIFYVNQTQREYPDEIMFDYFESRFEPEKVILLQGLDYAWIYPSLGVDHYLQDQTYTGIASLLAWQWAAGDEAPLLPGQSAEFELYWEYLGKKPDETFFFRLVDAQGRAWAEGLSEVAAGQNPPVARWREGEIIYERGALPLPADLPPGQYRLQIGFYTRAPAVTEGELLFTVPDEEALLTIGHAGPADYKLPAVAVPIDQPLGHSLTLLGAAWPTDALSPETIIPLDLYWRVERPLPAQTKLHVGLMTEGGEAQQAWFDLTLAETFNLDQTTWQPGDIVHTHWPLDLLPGAPPGVYSFELVLAENLAKTVACGKVRLEER